MAHFAEINDDNIVVQVVVVSDEHEDRGQEYLSKDLGLGGTWIKCSYNASIRRNYPGIGFIYLPEPDIFIPPQPYPSWSLNENYDWQPPVPRPEEGTYRWDEFTLSWVAYERPQS